MSKKKMNNIEKIAAISNTGTVQPKVYRTVKILREGGFGAEINFGYHVRQFKCKNGCEHYNHMICIICGACSYIDDTQLEDFQDQLAKSNGFKPTQCKFQIYGVCRECG